MRTGTAAGRPSISRCSSQHVTEVARFRSALTNAFSDFGPETEQAVHDCALEVARVLKLAGWPVEAVIIAVKQMCTECGAESGYHGRVMERVVAQVIDAYFTE